MPGKERRAVLYATHLDLPGILNVFMYYIFPSIFGPNILLQLLVDAACYSQICLILVCNAHIFANSFNKLVG